MIGVLSDSEIETMLHSRFVGRIGCSISDRPYVVPINYAYKNGFVYGYSGPGRKIDVMREQPIVCFEVDEIDNNSMWRSVIAEGLYEELIDDSARLGALALLVPAGAQAVSRSISAAKGIVVFRIRLTERSGRFERRDA